MEAIVKANVGEPPPSPELEIARHPLPTQIRPRPLPLISILPDGEISDRIGDLAPDPITRPYHWPTRVRI